MTRDDAKSKLMAETRSQCTEGWMEDFIDSAVALGLLKLDEPKTIVQRVDAAYKAYGYTSLTASETVKALHAANLKIVEADK